MNRDVSKIEVCHPKPIGAVNEILKSDIHYSNSLQVIIIPQMEMKPLFLTRAPPLDQKIYPPSEGGQLNRRRNTGFHRGARRERREKSAK